MKLAPFRDQFIVGVDEARPILFEDESIAFVTERSSVEFSSREKSESLPRKYFSDSS